MRDSKSLVKTCYTCKIEKSIDDFSMNMKYVRRDCRKCYTKNKRKFTLATFADYVRQSKSYGIITSICNNDDELMTYLIAQTSVLNDDTDTLVSQRLYHLEHDIKEHCICTICNVNDKIWDKKFCMYKNWCVDNACRTKFKRLHRDPEVEKLRVIKIKDRASKRTKEQKNEANNQRRITLLEKYGVDTYAKTDRFKEQMIDKLGVVSPFSLPVTHEKKIKTMITRYGVDHNFKIESVISNRKETWIERYGYDNPNKSEEIKQKTITTNQNRYGGNSPMCSPDIQKKSQDTLFDNYGVRHAYHNKDLYQKAKDTMMFKYGYEHWLQEPKNQQKMLVWGKQYKEYILPDERVVYLQGYEDYVLFEILMKSYELNDIVVGVRDITTSTGQIWYTMDGKTHKYYPDFYVKSINKVIEVKSTYTYKKDLVINILKMEQCKHMGMDFEFFIIEKPIYTAWKKLIKNKIK